MKTETSPQTIYLKDYQPPQYWIESVHLYFDLHENATRVTNTLKLTRNLNAIKNNEFRLNGEQLKLESIKIDGSPLEPSKFRVDEKFLYLVDSPEKFTLEIITIIEPQKNLAFEGLYKSNGKFCTQCEAEGFRKITYFLDRPDVMSVFTVTVEADKKQYPLLLSNGNKIDAKDLGNGRHLVKWFDPYKKPAYLFALVAGDLAIVQDKFRTASGRDVTLQIFCHYGHEDRCSHAMNSLKQSMKWDEDTFGLEYDLDVYMIVAVDDFNMGAMENKGLNIFNSSYVLAKPETATDTDYDNIQAVVGHEYFHNWTGNRVTCRDWFQLSLKEGLTVYRDQEFSADMTGSSVKRIEDVVRLRTNQFAEDAGPMAHPIRPQSYIEINNFYTLTVYEKGAEVIRMMRTILGKSGFRKGMDLYFKRHDGQAVTTEDFVAAMEDANSVNFTQFKNWYNQAGTPEVAARYEYNPQKGELSLHLKQNCPLVAGETQKSPFHIPISIGFLNSQGQDLPATLLEKSEFDHLASNHEGATIIHLTQPEQSFNFSGFKEKPVVSLLREFSAPIKLSLEQSKDELAFIMGHDTDKFNRWEASQKLAVEEMKSLVAQFQATNEPVEQQSSYAVDSVVLNAFSKVISDSELDPAFKAYIMALPSENYLSQFYKTINVEAIHFAVNFLRRKIAQSTEAELLKIYHHYYQCGEKILNAKSAGERALRNQALSYLCALKKPDHFKLALQQATEAKNMTDEIAALASLNSFDSPERKLALEQFYKKWSKESLVMNKWFSLHALTPIENALEKIIETSHNPSFDSNNPNKIYSLFGGFGTYNMLRFNDPSGKAYKWMADKVIEVDARNPQVASRLVSTFNQWKKLDPARQGLVKVQLQRIVAQQGISPNVFEIANKALAL